MDTKRVTLGFGLAILIAAVATFVLYRTTRGPKGPGADTRKVVAAAKAIESGSALTTENLVLVDWPTAHVTPDFFSKIDDVKGKALMYPAYANQPILKSDLAPPGSGIGLTVKIPEGMRATSVRSNEIIGVAGFLYPGSHVDVLVSYKAPEAKNPQMQTVLQNVEVLTAGQQIEPDPQGKPQTVNVVTLLLTPQDSEKLVLASEEGSIHFVLRNGADTAQIATNPVAMSQLIGAEARTPSATATTAPTPAAVRKTKPRPPVVFEVETIAGDKRVTDRFRARRDD